MFGEKKEKRFVECVNERANCGYVRVIVDTQTGVQYIGMDTSTGTGTTVLVDADGKPLLNKEWLAEHGQ